MDRNGREYLPRYNPCISVNNSDSHTIGLDSTTDTIDLMPTAKVGDVLSDRYRLDEEIGRGGMGIVFRGWDADLERAVAIKILGAHRQVGDARERLFREARAAAALSHPHVVAVHDVGEHHHMPFLVMELVEGPSLKERRPVSLDEIIEIATQLCGALGHAHEHGLIHRDLKPANVLHARSNGQPFVKIVDLGLAVRERGIRITREGGITGTVNYMAPEQALGQPVDGRTDLYALGVMLYEIFTGRLPFDGDNALAIISQHLHAPVVPPRTYRADIPEHLDNAILRLLAKDPDDRFATAGEVAAVLTRSPEAAAVTTLAGASTALGGLVRGRMVGRDREVDSLRRSWSEATLGRGGMVLVSGEPGSGKTRLARELVDYARITGGTVLSGGCYELEAATPYLPFVEALRTWVHQSSDDDLRSAVGDSGAELARLAPELASRIGPFPEGPDLSAAEQRLRLFDGVARCLLHLAEPEGLLLFIDDLQWADQASLSLLHYLVRLAGRERLVVLGCYRDTDLDRSHPLAEALDLWNRERAAVRVHLGRLEPQDTSAMVTGLLGNECMSEQVCTDIHRETEGNPFFIEEVVKTLVDEGQIVCEAGEWRRREKDATLVLPQGVKAAIGRRLDHVSEPTTEILRTAAILGKTFEFSELAAVADRSEDELLDALDEAVAAQLLETRSGESVIFTHDKIREVLYHELNPIRRRRLHTRVAEGLQALRERGGRVAIEDLAHHFMEGGCLERGFTYAMQAAADAAALYAYTDSIRLYERARDCAEALGRTGELSRIDTALGDVYSLKGEPLNAVEHYERVLAVVDEPSEQVRLECLIGEAYVIVGDARALEFVEKAKTNLDPEIQPTVFARATMIEARFHHYHGQSARAAELLLQAREPAERSGDIMLRAWIYGYLAGAYQHLIDFEESNRWTQMNVDLGEAEDNPNIGSMGFEFLQENAFMCGRWRECLEYAAHHRELGEKAQSSDRLAWNYLPVSYANYGLGNLAVAEAACDDGLQAAERLGDERLAAFLAGWRALIAAEQGRIDEAIPLADAAIERGDALGLKTGQLESRRSRACIALLEDDHQTVLDLTAQIDGLLEGTDESIQPVWMTPTRCQSLINTGQLDEAEQRLETTLESARTADMPHWEAMALKARAQLHAARGDDKNTRADLDAAIEIFEKLESRLELARTLLLRGGDQDLDHARELFEACGAPTNPVKTPH
jgi:tetratricopeptide (TPR) repeat protein